MSHNTNWFQSVAKKSASKAPAESNMLEIDRIAPASPAADLGLRRGDKLLTVNGKSALIEDIPMLLAKSSSVQYRFFLRNESAILEVETKGLPLGIQTSASSKGIAEQYKAKGEFEKDGLLTLWEREDHERIREACDMSNRRLNKYNFVGKLTGKPKSFSFTKMMMAICEIETGDAAAGYEALGRYEDDHSATETSDVQAILSFYRAQRAKTDGNLAEYQQHIERAFSSYSQSGRLRDEAASVGIETDQTDRRVGRTIQTAQQRDVLEGGKGKQSLQDVLEAMAPGQILPLCLMTTFRGNGPYNDALLPYIALQPNASERLHPMVVLTDVAEKRKDRPHWNSHEDLAKKVKCPLVVLHGSLDDVMGDFSPRAAPEFFALDCGGKIVWAGDLGTEFDYWDMLAKVV